MSALPTATQALGITDRSFLSWPFFEDRHRALADAMKGWIAAGGLPGGGHHEATVDADARARVAALAAGGWLNHCVPGDGPLDVRSLCLLREHLAAADGLADFSFAMQGLGSGPISLFGSDAQRTVLPEVAAGKKIAAFALSEPASGSDVASIATSARPEGNGWILEGEKTWISNAGVADFYTLFARTGDGPGAKGLSAFLVPATTPGLEVAERLPVIAPHPLGRLVMKDMRLPGDALVGKTGDGFRIAMAVLDVFRSTVGAAALGFARRALAEATLRASDRTVFGKSLAEQPVVQAMLADMALEIDAAALLVYRSAWTKDQFQGRVSREASMAKLYATEAAQRVIDSAVQIFGGNGVVVGNVVERLYREIRALRIYEGATEIQRVIIGGQVIASAKSAREANDATA